MAGTGCCPKRPRLEPIKMACNEKINALVDDIACMLEAHEKQFATEVDLLKDRAKFQVRHSEEV